MLKDQNKALVEQLFSEIMNKKKLSSIDKFIDPNFKWHGFTEGKPGPEGFKEVLQQFIDAFPDIQVRAEVIIADGDEVATRGYCEGTNSGSFMGNPPSNKKVKIPYIDWWKIKNGKAVENWVQMDSQSIMSQIGLAHAHETA